QRNPSGRIGGVQTMTATIVGSKSTGERAMERIARFIPVVILTALAFGVLGGPPAVALSRPGSSVTGGPVVVFDPCMPQPQVTSFTAAPASITPGESATLSWSVQVPEGCNYMLVLMGQVVGPEGTLAAPPVANPPYTLTPPWGPTRTLWTSATTEVDVTLPPLVEIQDNTED